MKSYWCNTSKPIWKQRAGVLIRRIATLVCTFSNSIWASTISSAQLPWRVFWILSVAFMPMRRSISQASPPCWSYELRWHLTAPLPGVDTYIGASYYKKALGTQGRGDESADAGEFCSEVPSGFMLVSIGSYVLELSKLGT